MCQVLYISYFIDSYLVDWSALTVSIHKVSGAQRGQGHSVKVTELVKCRTGPIFPDYCPGGCAFFCVFTSYPYSFFSERGEYSEKE